MITTRDPASMRDDEILEELAELIARACVRQLVRRTEIEPENELADQAPAGPSWVELVETRENAP